MTRIITIETQNDSAFEQIKTLAYKLGLKMREEPSTEFVNATDERYIVQRTSQEKQPNAIIQKLADLDKKYPPKKVRKDFDFNAVVDAGINI